MQLIHVEVSSILFPFSFTLTGTQLNLLCNGSKRITYDNCKNTIATTAHRTILRLGIAFIHSAKTIFYYSVLNVYRAKLHRSVNSKFYYLKFTISIFFYYGLIVDVVHINNPCNCFTQSMCIAQEMIYYYPVVITSVAESDATLTVKKPPFKSIFLT